MLEELTEFRETLDLHLPVYRIIKDTDEQLDEGEHRVKAWKGPEYRSFCPGGVLGVLPSWHVDVCITQEVLPTPQFGDVYGGFIATAGWIMSPVSARTPPQRMRDAGS